MAYALLELLGPDRFDFGGVFLEARSFVPRYDLTRKKQASG